MGEEVSRVIHTPEMRMAGITESSTTTHKFKPNGQVHETPSIMLYGV